MIGFWEKENNDQVFDVTIIGAGFTGLFYACYFLEKNANAKIAIIDTSFPPPGASLRNAGFACFGSPTEILDDLRKENENQTISRIEKRISGLAEMKKICGPSKMKWTNYGGHEIFRKNEFELFQKTCDQLSKLNKLIKPILGYDPYRISKKENHNFDYAIDILGEAQLNPFLTWKSLYSQLSSNFNISFITQRALHISSESVCKVECENLTVKSEKVFVASNGFSQSIFKDINIIPARAQVLITKPLENLPFKGSFHMDDGYLYFRNVKNRVLFGGARNLNKDAEATSEMELNIQIQERLSLLLKEFILPKTSFEVDYRWSGIMAFGKNEEKDYILEEIQPQVFVGARLGGMGVAISSALAKEALKKMG